MYGLEAYFAFVGCPFFVFFAKHAHFFLSTGRENVQKWVSSFLHWKSDLDEIRTRDILATASNWTIMSNPDYTNKPFNYNDKRPLFLEASIQF